MSVRTGVTRRALRWGVGASVVTVSLALAAPAVGASEGHRHDASEGHRHDGRRHHDNGYHQTNLISDQAGVAMIQDTNLVNPWGIASGVTANGPTPFWVSDNGKDITSIFAGAVHGSPIMQPRPPVNIPGGEPTGQVFNGTGRFKVTSGNKSDTALFIFAAESGIISGWSPNVDPANAVVAVTTPNAVYKGIAMARTEDGLRLYAANFHAGTVDVFDGRFMPVHGQDMFVDHNLPAGYAPFNIATIGHRVFVTYAQQDADQHDDVAGPGHGFIDVYTTEGHFLRRFASRGALNSPWGVVLAPESFGRFGGDLLVGNFGDGRINAFDPWSGRFLGQLRDAHHQPITIDGLWGLRFGNGTFSTPRTLVFTAGPDGEMHGLLGTLTARDD